MPIRLLATLALLIASVSLAQQPNAITNDPEPNPSAPTQNIETVIDSHGSRIMGLFLLASGTQPHPTVILLHGFPGYEQNIDLAQSLRRDGWNVLAMHYRGAWGSQGSFSFTHCMEDVSTMLAYVTQPANVTKFHIDTHHLVVIGHSMGGFMTVAALAQHPELKAGVVITEGSPVRRLRRLLRRQRDPADYAPLAGTSLTALQQRSQGPHHPPGASPPSPPKSLRAPSSTSPPTTASAPPTKLSSTRSSTPAHPSLPSTSTPTTASATTASLCSPPSSNGSTTPRVDPRTPRLIAAAAPSAA